jgi:hypothetical protein
VDRNAGTSSALLVGQGAPAARVRDGAETTFPNGRSPRLPTRYAAVPFPARLVLGVPPPYVEGWTMSDLYSTHDNGGVLAPVARFPTEVEPGGYVDAGASVVRIERSYFAAERMAILGGRS